METSEQVAGDACSYMHKRFSGSDWTKELPMHICLMLGNNEWGLPLWRRRAMPPHGQIFELDRFEDYLMLQYRRGLGFESWHTIHAALETQGRRGAEAIALIRTEVPDYEEKVRIDKQRNIDASSEVLAKLGRPAKGSPDKADNISLKHGTSATYLVAKLKRDHPDIARRYANGEFRSARAAAIAAGVLTPPSRIDTLLKHWRLATDAEKAAFLKAVGHA